MIPQEFQITPENETQRVYKVIAFVISSNCENCFNRQIYG